MTELGVNPGNVETSVSYIGLEHMPKRSISLSDWESSEKIKSNKFSFKKGDILFGKLRPYFHKVGIAPINGICSTDIVVINAQEIIYYGYLIALLSSDEFVSYCTAISTGTKMPRTKWKDMRRYQTILPPEEVLDRYNKLICSFVEKIVSNVHEASFLSSVRDTLLPKLISGQIRLDNLEQFLNERCIDN